MHRLMAIMVLLGGLVSSAGAVDIQYRLTGENEVTGVSDTPLTSVDGYGIVTLVGHTSSELVWPVPAGCAAGTSAWTRISDPDNVNVFGGGMAVRSGLPLFHTTSTLLPGCFLMRSKVQLAALVNRTIKDALDADNPLGESLTRIETRNLRVCPNENGNCASAHTKLNHIRNVQSTDDDAFDALLTQIDTLKDDYDAFVASQGW
jgi:hypothetical protein